MGILKEKFVVDEIEDQEKTKIDKEISSLLTDGNKGSLCVGSSTGEILSLKDRVEHIRQKNGLTVSNCFWGGFVK